jgi:hypothetical protein
MMFFMGVKKKNLLNGFLKIKIKTEWFLENVFQKYVNIFKNYIPIYFIMSPPNFNLVPLVCLLKEILNGSNLIDKMTQQ